MPDDALDRVLRLVGEGRLTAEEAAPILDALDGRREGSGPAEGPRATRAGHGPGTTEAPRFARIEITESGRKAVDLRIPLALGGRVLGAIPGLSAAQTVALGDAVSQGHHGPIVDITDEDGDGVRIGLE
jgi:hypothetical protein